MRLSCPQYLFAAYSRCNLHCTGCYARAEGNCSDDKAVSQLSAEEWGSVFRQGQEMGVSFILLAGGEPLIRKDVLKEAAKLKTVAFPVFTNGTLFDDEYLELFDEHRNLIPVVSIEGDERATDARRGEGVAEKINGVLGRLRERGILFAASVTVTKENLREVATEEYIELLRASGCPAVAVFSSSMFPPRRARRSGASEEETQWLAEEVAQLKERHGDMCISLFPGDEDKTDGCLAAGRGFSM